MKLLEYLKTMLANTLMWSAIFISASHPSDPLTDARLSIGVDTLSDVLAVSKINAVPAIDVDVLADKNANGLAAVMTPLEFTLPTT